MNLFSQSQDPGASQTLEAELESQRWRSMTSSAGLTSVVCMFGVNLGCSGGWRGQNQNTWRWFRDQFQNKAQTRTTDSLSSCVADYEKTSE